MLLLRNAQIHFTNVHDHPYNLQAKGGLDHGAQVSLRFPLKHHLTKRQHLSPRHGRSCGTCCKPFVSRRTDGPAANQETAWRGQSRTLGRPQGLVLVSIDQGNQFWVPHPCHTLFFETPAPWAANKGAPWSSQEENGYAYRSSELKVSFFSIFQEQGCGKWNPLNPLL